MEMALVIDGGFKATVDYIQLEMESIIPAAAAVVVVLN